MVRPIVVCLQITVLIIYSAKYLAYIKNSTILDIIIIIIMLTEEHGLFLCQPLCPAFILEGNAV
jgi:hypothetical protein